MVLSEFLTSMGKLEVLTHVGLDDYADKLNFLFSVWFLFVFCTITTVKTYFLNPISCYIPNIVGSHEGQAAYINNICYTEGTYNVPLHEFKISVEDPNWHLPYAGRKIYYYQWLPFLLGVQGIMFYTPRIVWHMFANNRTGSDLSQLIKIAHEAQKAEGDKREKLVRHVCKQLELWINNTRAIRVGHCASVRRSLYSRLSVLVPSKRLGTWLVFVYFVVKLLYVANLVLQLLTMTKVLQVDQSPKRRNTSLLALTAQFGVQLLSDLAAGQDWQNTGLFPRSGCCAVYLRQAAKAQHLFAQCAIPVNMIHEKIYIFLWFWFVLVLALTLLSIFLWCGRMLHANRRTQLPKKFLYLSGLLSRKNDDEKKMVSEFARKFLRHDGTFVLHMLALNCGDVVCTEICTELYRAYRDAYHPRDLRGDLDEATTYVVNASHSSLALSPSNGKRQRCRRQSSCNSECNHEATKRRSQLEPSAPLVEEATEKRKLTEPDGTSTEL